MSEPLGQPKWYDLWVEVNGHEPALEPRYTAEELAEVIVELVRGFRDDQDLGSWAVLVSPHWCDENGPCECLSAYSETRLAEFKGMTIDDLERGTI